MPSYVKFDTLSLLGYDKRRTKYLLKIAIKIRDKNLFCARSKLKSLPK